MDLPSHHAKKRESEILALENFQSSDNLKANKET